MDYFKPQSLSDIQEMQERGDAEGPNLEYKSSKLLSQKNERVFESLSKEVTAFANSIGGVLIIGVEEDSDRRISEISPISDETKTDSWLEDGLLSRINPSLRIDILKVDVGNGHLLIIDVPASRSAPHQASDKRFYARRLFRVDPLLAYEVDDIRRRSIENPQGAYLSISARNGGIDFTIKNQQSTPIYDVDIKVSGITNASIAEQWSPGLSRPYTEPFKIIHPGDSFSFLGAGYEFFAKQLKDEMKVTLSYSDVDGGLHQTEYFYFLKDLESRVTKKTPLETALAEGFKHLEGIKDSLSRISDTMRDIKESAVHPTGLNLSKTTLSALAGREDFKWSGPHLSFQALAEVLEVESDEAYEIYRGLFGASHYVGGSNKSIDELELSDEVKAKILKKLTIPKKE